MRNTFGWMGAGGPGGSLAGSSKESGPKSGSNIAQQYVDGYAFLCALQYKVTGKFQRSKIFSSQVSYQKKNVYVI